MKEEESESGESVGTKEDNDDDESDSTHSKVVFVDELGIDSDESPPNHEELEEIFLKRDLEQHKLAAQKVSEFREKILREYKQRCAEFPDPEVTDEETIFSVFFKKL